MQISSRFSMALHIFSCIGTYENKMKITSDLLAFSVNVNPVIIRRLLQQFKAAGFITVQRGTGGLAMAKPMEEITLLDVYQAVECIEDGELFRFHENPNPECMVGRNIHNILDGRLQQVQQAMEDELRSVTIADIVTDTRRCISEEKRAASEKKKAIST